MSELLIEERLSDCEAWIALAGRLAVNLPDRGLLRLSGPLGSGKTTLVRALLRALGWQGEVTSPSFVLHSVCRLDQRTVHHLDLYRISTPEEILPLEVEELVREGLVLVEWPEKGDPFLPKAKRRIEISEEGRGRLCRIFGY